MSTNKPTQWILPLYGVLMVALLLGWWLLPGSVSPLRADQKTSVITQFSSAVLNNPLFLALRPRSPVRLTQQVTAIATNAKKPAPPQQLQAIDQGIGSTITLTWQAAKGEEYKYYQVYRSISASAEGKAVLLADKVAETSYTDTKAETGTTYTYTVIGVGTGSSQPSEAATATATDSTPPHAPSHILATNTGEGSTINLTWTNPPDQDFASLNIYRSTVFGQRGELLVQGLTGETYLDTKVPDNNVEVYYTVTSVDTTGNESPSTLRTSPPGNANPFQVLYQ